MSDRISKRRITVAVTLLLVGCLLALASAYEMEKSHTLRAQLTRNMATHTSLSAHALRYWLKERKQQTLPKHSR